MSLLSNEASISSEALKLNSYFLSRCIGWGICLDNDRGNASAFVLTTASWLIVALVPNTKFNHRHSCVVFLLIKRWSSLHSICIPYSCPYMFRWIFKSVIQFSLSPSTTAIHVFLESRTFHALILLTFYAHSI